MKALSLHDLRALSLYSKIYFLHKISLPQSALLKKYSLSNFSWDPLIKYIKYYEETFLFNPNPLLKLHSSRFGVSFFHYTPTIIQSLENISDWLIHIGPHKATISIVSLDIYTVLYTVYTTKNNQGPINPSIFSSPSTLFEHWMQITFPPPMKKNIEHLYFKKYDPFILQYGDMYSEYIRFLTEFLTEPDIIVQQN